MQQTRAAIANNHERNFDFIIELLFDVDFYYYYDYGMFAIKLFVYILKEFYLVNFHWKNNCPPMNRIISLSDFVKNRLYLIIYLAKIDDS